MDSGVFGGFKRMFTGESFFITNFLNNGSARQSVTFAAPYPGKIIPIEMEDYGKMFICQKDSFLCAAYGIDVTVAFSKKIGAGLFGGEGFILQKLEGEGLAFLHAGGTIIKRKLEAGQTLRVDTGCIVGFEQSVEYDIKFVGGIKNSLFGGEGLFHATVKGPGTVFLQSLPFSRLADRLAATRAFAGGTSGGESGLGEMLGGFVSGE